MLAAFALGAARYTSSLPNLDDPGFIASYNDDGETYTLTGLLIEPPDERDTYTNLIVQAIQIRPRDGITHSPVGGQALVRVEPGGNWQYGDLLVITGQIQTPPQAEDFSYADYLARRGIYAYMPFARASLLESGYGHPVLAAIYGFKTRAFEATRQIFPDPEASLLAGILLGIESGIPPDLQDAFRNTGTSHIIAISGFNITIIAAIFLSLFGRLFGERRGSLFAVAGIAAHTLLVGADAAVVRAALMGTLAIFFRLRGERRSGISILLAAAVLMAAANPLVLGDAGFQLSFAATLGLILYAQPLTEWFARWFSRYQPLRAVRRLTPLIADAFLLTLAAQITTLPVIIYHFQRVSLISFLANPLILPAQPAVMILGGTAVLAGMLYLPLGQILGYLALPFAAYTIRMVEFLDKFPGGVIALGTVSVPVVILLYAILAGVTFRGGRVPRGHGASRWAGMTAAWRAVLLAVLILLATTAWRSALAAPDGNLRITVLDVGMGDGILIHTPEGRWILIDGGPSTTLLSDQLGRRIPAGQRTLDWLVVAGTGDAQLGGLPRVLERYPPANVLWTGPQNISRGSRALQEFLTGTAVPVTAAADGMALSLGSGGSLKVVRVTERGAVLLIEWGNFRGLFPVGADFESAAMGMPPVNVLLLAEGGFAPVNPPGWIAGLQPELVLLSVAAGNREGLPSPEIAQFLSDYPLLRTDRNGWIEIVTDGEQMWVTAEKP
jgi:competence protein ComEC